MWTGISWASTKASASPASIAEPSSRPRETSISESWQLQKPSNLRKQKFLNSKEQRHFPGPKYATFEHSAVVISPSEPSYCMYIEAPLHSYISCHDFERHIFSWEMLQAQIDGARGGEVRLWPVWCWVHSAGKPQKAQTIKTWTGTNKHNRNIRITNFFYHRYDGSVTYVSPHSRTKATWGDTSWQSTKAPLTTVTSARHSLETMEHCADIFSQNTRESGEKLIKNILSFK